MVTTEVRQVRPPVFLLPAVLLVVLFGVAVLLAQVAPSRVTSGVYQVVVGDGAARIPAEALTCSRTAATATCTTLVDGRRLTVEVHYTGVPRPGPCAAWHGDRVVSCQPTFGYYGHRSHTVWIADDLGLSGTQLAGLASAAPWWRLNSHLTTAMLVVTGTLGALAGVATFLLYRRFRPVRPDQRTSLVVGTAVLGSALFVGSGLLLDPSGTGPLMLLSPVSLLASAALACWQWQLAGARGGRVVSAVVATLTVAIYTGAAAFVFLMQSGFED
jgi:hypothetical protein